MESSIIIKTLEKQLPKKLATDLVDDFIKIKIDTQVGNFGNSAPGKFVETIVQIIQFLETGSFDVQPKVDNFLKGLESRSASVDDDIRITLQRIARAQYTLRNKRNIAHKGDINPSLYDLKYIYSSAQWILSELIRKIENNDKDLAGKMIEFIQTPFNSIVERFGDTCIIHGKFTIEQELLVLLHSNYPDFCDLKTIQKSLERRSKSAISNSLKSLWIKKEIFKTDSLNYKLTQSGYQRANEIIIESTK